jgi:cell wall-associated NlpC family hydrolase
MRTNIQALIQEIAREYSDTRLQVFDVNVEDTDEKKVTLAGRVLDEAALANLRQAFASQLPGVRVDLETVAVLRKAHPAYLHVGTNLTSLHAGSSFLAEMVSQLTYGARLEILHEDGKWAHVRQDDGYLGWTYRPYLTEAVIPEPTHTLLAPAAGVRAEPNEGAAVLTRLFAGTRLHVEAIEGQWAEVRANATGWVALQDLRPLSEKPAGEARRAAMLRDGRRMIGTPYLWGGATGNGIDCSGFSRLLHHWLGVDIPRDADMQCRAAGRVEPPFQAGDLLFFGEAGESRRVTHVGLSLGGWEMIHSSRTRNGVYVDNVEETAFLREIFLQAGSFLRE